MKRRLLAGFLCVSLCMGIFSVPISAEEITGIEEIVEDESKEINVASISEEAVETEKTEESVEEFVEESVKETSEEQEEADEIKEATKIETEEASAIGEEEEEIIEEDALLTSQGDLPIIDNVEDTTLDIDIDWPPGSDRYYQIVPNKTAFYTFSSIGDGYTFGSIYEDGQSIGGQDGLSEQTGDFTFTICLEQGKTYEFRTGWASYRLGSFQVNVKRKIAIIGEPEDCSAKMGGTAHFSVESDNGVKYQWQFSKDGGKTWYNSSTAGAKTETISFKVTSSNYQNLYRCVITYKGISTYTQVVAIDLIPSAKIVKHPESVVTKVGEQISFTCSAENDEKYQWQYSKDGGANWYKSTATGAGNATFTMTVSTSNKNNLYRCEVTGTDGNKKYSNAAGIIVATKLPTDVTTSIGNTIAFTLEAANISSYQWQYSKNETDWFTSSATGAKTKKLTLKASETNKDNAYRCKVTDSRGLTAYTPAAHMVIAGALTIDSSTTKIHFSKGARAPFRVSATNAASYQWQYSKDNGKTWYSSSATGAKTNYMVLVMSDGNKNTWYRCKVTGLDGSIQYTEEVAFEQHDLYYGYDVKSSDQAENGITSEHYVTCRICHQKGSAEAHQYKYPSEYSQCTVCGVDRWLETEFSEVSVKAGSADEKAFNAMSCSHANGTMRFATLMGYVQFSCLDCGFYMTSKQTSILVGNME